MLSLISILSAVAAATGATPAAAQPAFTFRDWHARDEHQSDDPRLAQCVPIPAGKACTFTDNRIAGVEARQIGAAFGRNGLFALEAKFPSGHGDTVLAALRQRYGSPCETKTERPRQLMTGKVIPRTIAVWCFKDGRATFSSITASRSEASFEFATHDAAKQASIQDF